MTMRNCLLAIKILIKYTLNSEPKALTGDKSEGIKSRGAAEAFIRGFSPVKAEGEEFNVLILSYTRELSRPFKETKDKLPLAKSKTARSTARHRCSAGAVHSSVF